MFAHLEQFNNLRARLSIAGCPLVASLTSGKLRLEKNVHLIVVQFVQNDLITSLMSRF